MLAVITIWLSSAWALSPDDEAARRLLLSVREKIERAKTLNVDIIRKDTSGTSTLEGVKQRIRVKGKGRFRAELTYPTGIKKLQYGTTLVADGRKVLPLKATLAMSVEPYSLERTASEVRRMFTAAPPLYTYLSSVDDDILDGPRSLPEPMNIRDGGEAQISGTPVRIVEFRLLYTWGVNRGKPVTVRLFIDPEKKTLVRRESHFHWGMRRCDYTRFDFDGELEDSVFSVQTRGQYSKARTALVARWIDIYTLYTGRYPKNLQSLLTPPNIDNRKSVWPRTGYLAGGKVPEDAWGKRYDYRHRDGKVFLTTYGADGKPGGTGDDADLEYTIWQDVRRPIVPPSERLRKYYTAKLEVRLLAEAMRSYRDAYGELPQSLDDLSTRADWMDYWPEGGWISGGTLRTDPWGEPYLLKHDPVSARVYVRNPERAILPSDLTPDETAQLQEAARPRLDDPKQKAVEKLLDRLSDDDLETRETALKELREWGGILEYALKDRLKVTKDKYIRKRLTAVYEKLEDHEPSWKAELGGLRRTVFVWSMLQSQALPSFDQYSWKSLRILERAQKQFRERDADGNRKADYWTGDVAGLYALLGRRGSPIALIPRRLAAADAHPLKDPDAGVRYDRTFDPDHFQPLGGCSLRIIAPRSAVGNRDASERTNTPLRGDRFAYAAFPAEYGVMSRFTLILNDEGTLYARNLEGREITRWPDPAELKNRWTKLPPR